MNKIFGRLLCFSVLIAFTFYDTPYCAAQASWQQGQIESTKINSVKTTKYGILAGEFDPRLWLQPFNGVYISNDLGKTWSRFALNSRGITDMEYAEGKIYVTTYYHHQNQNGLFIYQEETKEWLHKGPNVSLNTVFAANGIIAIGGVSHGLWISKDQGDTWIQKIGDGYTGPKIEEVKMNQDVMIATTSNKVFRSIDNGDTWQEITNLANKNLTQVEITEGVILLGSSGTEGIYKSRDNGKTWLKVLSWGNGPVGDIRGFGYKIFATQSGSNPKVMQTDIVDLVRENIITDNLITQNALITLDWAYYEDLVLIAAAQSVGVFTRTIPLGNLAMNPIFETPWQTKTSIELLDKIYSYFDHEYPLLGYPYYRESNNERGKTLNYLGHSAEIPELYYSSHDGYDFALPYGKDVLAAKEGIASYGYDEDGLGNYITIDHLNGYQTTYAHLQGQGLVATNAKQKVQVRTGDIIGKIGMTGNTDGPHLHFSVETDINKDGKFDNEDIGGKSDPFGWQDNISADPWANKSWSDTIGTHKGTISYYNWINPLDYHKEVLINTKGGEIEIDKWKVTFHDTVGWYNFVTNFTPSSVNTKTVIDTTLKYIPETAFVLNAYSLAAKTINKFDQPLEIRIDLTNADLTNIAKNTIKIYFFNTTSNTWEPLNSALDITNNILTAQSDHLTSFAAFGEKIDKHSPQTMILIEGTKDYDWYVEAPLITITTSDTDSEEDLLVTYYSLDNGNNWEIYTTPLTIDTQGISNILYRAQDSSGNLAPTSEKTLKVDLLNQYNHKTAKISKWKFGT